MEAFLWPLVIFHVIVGIVGLPGNALIVLVYGRKRQLMSPHVFILALAVADLMVCLFTPVTVYHWFIRLNYTSDFLCRLVLTATFITVYNSCFLTSAIAVDRYQAICRPHRRWMTVRRAKITAVLCLVLAVVFVLPVFASFGVEPGAGSQTGTCTFSTETPKWVKYLMFTLIYVAPFSTLVINTILYGKIYLVVRKQAAVRPGQVASMANRSPDTELDRPTSNGVSMVSHNCRQPAPNMDVPSTSNQPNTTRTSVAASTHKQPPNNNSALSTPGPTTDGAPVAPNGSNKRRPNEAGKFHNKTTKMLLITTLVYFFTWFIGIGLLSIPIETQDYIHQYDPVGSAFLYLFSFVFYVNNAINPFIYGFVNRRFVQDCQKTLTALRCKRI